MFVVRVIVSCNIREMHCSWQQQRHMPLDVAAATARASAPVFQSDGCQQK
jgi:hypothetical protein